MGDSGTKNWKDQTVGYAGDHILCEDENMPDDSLTEGQEAVPYVKDIRNVLLWGAPVSLGASVMTLYGPDLMAKEAIKELGLLRATGKMWPQKLQSPDYGV